MTNMNIACFVILPVIQLVLEYIYIYNLFLSAKLDKIHLVF